MTPKRLATLCRLLPGFRFTEDVAPTNDAVYVQFDGEWHDVSEASHVADHLLMEALRAVRKRGFIVSTQSELDSADNANESVTLWTNGFNSAHYQGSSDNPLHALLDAVMEAGL